MRSVGLVGRTLDALRLDSSHASETSLARQLADSLFVGGGSWGGVVSRRRSVDNGTLRRAVKSNATAFDRGDGGGRAKVPLGAGRTSILRVIGLKLALFASRTCRLRSGGRVAAWETRNVIRTSWTLVTDRAVLT